jgi:FtsP/CotA-like multicopper oxidase with cupredoxin domain
VPCSGSDPTSQTPQALIEFVVVPTSKKHQSFSPPGGALRQGHGSGPYDVIEKLPTKQHGARVRERTFVFGFTGHIGHNPFATVNGRLFDDTHIYARPVLNSIEIWHLVNTTDGYHPVHPHDIEFQVISRSRCKTITHPDTPKAVCVPGGPRLPVEPGDWSSCPAGGSRCNLAWKDVFVVPPYSQVTIIGRFTDNLGVYVFHCHNLIHEDAGMMAQFEVVKRRPTS